jgi:DNA-binding CsgD family transcriptional regulator/RimJ/RimL family protein N-acetyltransferase
MPPTQSGPLLRTGRLLLRPPEPEDIAPITRACQDEALVRWTNTVVPYFPSHAETWVREHTFTVDSAQRWWANPTWCVIDNGWLASVELQIRERAADVAFLPGPNTSVFVLVETLRAVARWAFTVLGVDVIRWTGAVGNESAILAVDHAGFHVHQDVSRLGFVQRGARRDAVIADLLPEDLNEAPRGKRSAGSTDLTPRESEVLSWIAHGRSNREIATTLQISENTVKNHVASILDKLPASSRVQAVVVGVQRGIVRMPSSP